MNPTPRQAPRTTLAAALLLLLLLAACGAGGGGDASGTAPAPSQPSESGPPPPSLTDVDAQPIEHRQEAIFVAFDAKEAAELLQEVPGDLDFGREALACVFLGPRQTTGWSLDLRSATLSNAELALKARENPPHGATQDRITYPADCALVNRDALPPGELAVRADDTISGELIARTQIVVPEAPTSP
jgi:hypothetical protein